MITLKIQYSLSQCTILQSQHLSVESLQPSTCCEWTKILFGGVSLCLWLWFSRRSIAFYLGPSNYFPFGGKLLDSRKHTLHKRWLLTVIWGNSQQQWECELYSRFDFNQITVMRSHEGIESHTWIIALLMSSPKLSKASVVLIRPQRVPTQADLCEHSSVE